MSDEPESFRDTFVRGNANLEFISHQFAAVIRNLMRASVASDPQAALHRASEEMNFVAELMSKTEEEFSFHALFARSIKLIKGTNDHDSEVERAIVRAAEQGVKFLVERSCGDNAAAGRASRREDEFLTAIRWIDDARGEMRDRRKTK
jgi:hypothetical protein